MFKIVRYFLVLLFIYLPLPLLACGSKTQIVKKPEGLRKENIAPSNNYLTTQDRLKWKSALNWCDECDERAKPFTNANEKKNGRIVVYPIGGNQYIVDVKCSGSWQQSEHLYYKVTEHDDTIESRLLEFEQFFHAEYGDDTLVRDVKDPKGEFVRFTDTLAYGMTHSTDKTQPLLIIENRYRGMGGCGLYTVYDVSGECPKVIDFRAKVECTEDSPPPEKWKLFPDEQRSKWRIVPSPLRYDWKSLPTPACSK